MRVAHKRRVDAGLHDVVDVVRDGVQEVVVHVEGAHRGLLDYDSIHAVQLLGVHLPPRQALVK